MKFIDPFPTKCECCNEKNLYPVKDLLAYEAHCKSCGSRLIDGPLGMHKGKRLIAIDLWPVCLLLDACEEFDLDIDRISDEEFDNMYLVKDFIKNIEKMGFTGEPGMILELAAMKELNKLIVSSNFEQYSLKELALLANPEVKPGY